ncbi:hypothetical protein Tco_0772286 [Tanacetum coccineum]|uniref:Uncharacterized protein n=1 Tax=Tanacetum coccineum TaxID=301880 RepID=A0ABQ4ZKV6_9ASTR
MNSIEQCIIERASHEQELKMTLKKLSERQLQIQQCKVQEEVSPEESSSTSQPLEQVKNHDENDVFANVRRHSEQPESINDTYVLEKDDSNVIPDSSNICTNDNQVDQNAAECVDERAALANLIANLTLDTEENKTVLKQLKKANASLTQELKECKTNLDESSRALGEATSSRDSSLIALQTKQTELEKYTALNDKKFCPNGEETVTLEKESRSKLDKDTNKDAKSHKTTKRYMPVEKSSESKKPERLIPKGHRFSHKKTTTVPEKTMNPRSSLRWQPTGRILKTVCLRWVPTGKLLNSCTGKVESEPTHGSNVDIHHIHACKQTLGLSAGTSFNGQKQQRIDITADALYNEKQENLRVCSSLGRQCQMASAENNTSGPVPQCSKCCLLTSVHGCFHQMTSVHNVQNSRIQDHNNETVKFQAGQKSCSITVQHSYTHDIELELQFHTSYSNAEDNSHKVVRLGINPMIQPEPEDLPKDNPKLEIAVLSWKDDGYCNGDNLPGAYIVGNTLHYQDLEWYEALKDSKLKEEALKNKAIMEGIFDEYDESSNEGWRRGQI